MSKCPKCQNDVDGSKYCPNCGSLVNESENENNEKGIIENSSIESTCPNCLHVTHGEKFCPECGAILIKESKNPDSDNKPGFVQRKGNNNLVGVVLTVFLLFILAVIGFGILIFFLMWSTYHK